MVLGFLTFCLQYNVRGVPGLIPFMDTHPWVAPLFSSLQLATGTSCKKTLKLDVLSPSLHAKTQSWKLLLTVVAASRDVLLSLPSCPLCCCLCPIMFVPCLCCYHVVMLCCYHAVCHVLLPCYVVVLGLFLCSVLLS